MGWFVLGLCLLIAALLAGRAIVSTDPKSLARLARYIGGGILGVIAVFLLVTGRWSLALPVGALALMVLGRSSWLTSLGLPGGMRFPGSGSKQSGQSSNVETEYLAMSLDHDSGTMDGEVRKGAFAGRRLGDLSLQELVTLWQECKTSDPQSAALIETYIDRIHGTDWRGDAEDAGTGAGEAGDTAGGADARREKASGWRRNRPRPGGAMTREEAYEILGLEKGAGPDKIKAAHRRLMRKVHPDQGGTSGLAARINAAKDLLLGR